MREYESEPFFIFRDEKECRWLIFDNPVEIIKIYTLDDVIPSLKKVDKLIKSGLWAAGYISYEATAAFDTAGDAYPPDDFPLLYFAFFNNSVTSKNLTNYNNNTMPIFLDWTPEITEHKYRESLRKIKKYIEDGDIYQVNFTYRLRADFEIDPFLYFVNIYESHPVPYAAYANLGKYAICSFSPELFFSIDNKKITSQPMKGTAKRGKNNEDDQYFINLLKNNIKEKAENIMIVDIVRNDIGRVAKIGSVRVPELCCVNKYRTVLQMISTVEGETETSFDEIIRALFPPASVTGAPKMRATQIIRELESSPRHLYCGTIGWISPRKRNASFNVAIRSVIIDKEKKIAEYGTGSGIVWDSDEEKEFSECYLKTHIVTMPFKEIKLVETILWTKKDGYFLLEFHLKRIANSAEYFSYQFDRDECMLELEEISKKFYDGQYRVRLTLNKEGKLEINFSPLSIDKNNKEITLFIALDPIDSKNVFLYHKTTNRSHYEKYKDAIKDVPEKADILFVNEKREVTETTIANIVAEIDGEKYTPPLSCGLLNGVFREYLLTNGVIKEKILTLEELKNSTAIFRINSVRRWEKCKLEDFIKV